MSNIKKIIKFEAPWCAPCKLMDERLTDFPINIEHVNIENDENQLVEKYKVKNIPTFLFIDNKDEVVSRISGIATRQDMLDVVYGLKK